MNTPQDTLDALSSYLTENAIIDLLVQNALGILRYDDAHPDVGMGMFAGTAVDEAAKSLKEEAERWGRRVYIGKGTIAKAIVITQDKRRNR